MEFWCKGQPDTGGRDQLHRTCLVQPLQRGDTGDILHTIRPAAFPQESHLFCSRRDLWHQQDTKILFLFTVSHLYRFCTQGKKARDKNHRSKLRSLLSRERSTRLEGSFGTEKEHYNLRKVKAVTLETEILWIPLGIHTVNAVRLAGRQLQKEQKKAA